MRAIVVDDPRLLTFETAEERLLSDEKFFGKDYLEYKKRTGTLIPFIP